MQSFVQAKRVSKPSKATLKVDATDTQAMNVTTDDESDTGKIADVTTASSSRQVPQQGALIALCTYVHFVIDAIRVMCSNTPLRHHGEQVLVANVSLRVGHIRKVKYS